MAAFADQYFLQESMVRSALERRPRQFNAIDNRSALKIDFWLLTPDPFEQSMFSRRLSRSLFGTQAWIASAEDVLLHKLVWDQKSPSERQVNDAAGVLAVQADQLDVAYLRDWGARLGVLQTLEKLLRGEIRPKAT